MRRNRNEMEGVRAAHVQVEDEVYDANEEGDDCGQAKGFALN